MQTIVACFSGLQIFPLKLIFFPQQRYSSFSSYLTQLNFDFNLNTNLIQSNFSCKSKWRIFYFDKVQTVLMNYNKFVTFSFKCYNIAASSLLQNPLQKYTGMLYGPMQARIQSISDCIKSGRRRLIDRLNARRALFFLAGVSDHLFSLPAFHVELFV